ncbi:glycerophosphodiester phosphodiesterase [Mangrovibrevibacter kandeliae]|uniref:glycerophosphodiester phosphodiesterase n=1 Tax=Mangrovibrevibacter kandeliae TaxID=2968473 RepID=UPI0021188C9E|nr:glycerophosphodiester phosphodiesterase family protein [Aurantimonas sp. CSK15Z-1]MCQ8781863.1 glycerophosphodiester phosphodiesterase [Aurantimonas sp. CSK15Z-1]
MIHDAVPAIVAHRGFSARSRENSPDAWRGAVDAGADLVEADIRMTRDGTLVCCHDADLARLADRADAISEIDANELASITASGAPAAPTLDLLFATLPPTQAILFDVKDERPQVLDRLVGAVEAAARGAVIFGLHRTASVRHLRTRTTAPILGLLIEGETADAFFEAGGDILRLWEGDASCDAIRAVAVDGRAVWITTGHRGTPRRVGDFDADGLRRMAAAGATGFLVNDPEAARAALRATDPEGDA